MNCTQPTQIHLAMMEEYAVFAFQAAIREERENTERYRYNISYSDSLQQCGLSKQRWPPALERSSLREYCHIMVCKLIIIITTRTEKRTHLYITILPRSLLFRYHAYCGASIVPLCCATSASKLRKYSFMFRDV